MFAPQWVTLIFTLYYISTEACAPNENCDINLDDKTIQAIITGIEKFTNNLMIKLYTDVDVVGNILFSPIGVYSVLAILLLGSKGTTYDVLAEALGFPQADLQQLENSLATILQAFEVIRTEMNGSEEIIYEEVILGQGLFVHKLYSLLDSHRNFLRTIAAADFTVDYETEAEAVIVTMNEWVSNNTGKRITVGVESTFPTTSKLVLVSTVYFSAQWDHNLFEKKNSGTGQFLTSIGYRDVQMMSTTKSLLYYENSSASFSAVQLPFKGDDYTMVVVLPWENVNSHQFAENFTMDEYKKIIELSQPTKVRCTIPTFIGGFASTLRKYIQEMGMSQLFEGCDLGNMIQNLNENMKVQEVLHATAMEINEAGFIASVITATFTDVFGVSLMQVEADTPIQFLVNRPFLMFVNHVKTSLPLYTTFIREL